MKLNKQIQYGLLLTFYLSRSGRASLADISQTLKLSKSFLEQVANKLKKYQIIKSTRGAHGGYEILGDPTVQQIFDCLSSVSSLSVSDFQSYRIGQQEHRTLAQFGIDMNQAMTNVFRRKLRSVVLGSVANEVAEMNKINPLSKAIN